ncbi:unnamed protein product [Rotaria sp. Silwood2]|nr:unnamed protein product [Rotaria sp. Silwood2]CAF2811865.1 unnamed protein product [Rotaria sp. Silwood2]CAF2977859.1 unnamed protein product [Rotaria sp. Silwood2]CAF3868454.1 unnamed protein product [Rotaria sp. Silwood2]CAF3894166.1 unnamed protein product [Rotaria sp. Silwood2]
MAETSHFDDIIKSHSSIRQLAQESIHEFICVRQQLLHELNEIDYIQAIDERFKSLINTTTIQSLNKQMETDRIQLAICGENSSGKTTFIHMFLQIGKVMPTNAGPVSARIVKFTYAPFDQACIRVYESLEDRTCLDYHDLSDFFRMEKVNWSGIESILRPHLARPISATLSPDEFERSKEFVEWARKFVEIQLPSPTLKVGIDVYDTPGFLFHDAPILKENVHNLVKLTQPTIVYMYSNPMVTDETINGFLALKSALVSLDNTSMFFLNSQVDIDRYPDISDETTEDEFRPMLVNERRKRYEMLVSAPTIANDILGGLPPTVDQCSYFDLCSATSHDDPLGRLMNDACIKSIVRFAANSSLSICNRIFHLIMREIDTFFSLRRSLSDYTTHQLENKRDNALKWLNEFEREHQKRFGEFLDQVFTKIDARLKFVADILIRRAVSIQCGNNIKDIETYLNVAIQQEVIKQSVNEVLQSIYEKIILAPLTEGDYLVGNSNEILCEALCYEEDFRSSSNDGFSSSICQNFAVKMLRSPALLVVHVLDEESDNDREGISGSVRSLIAHRTANRHQRQKTRQQSTSTVEPIIAAENYLNEIQEQINDRKKFLKETIQAWLEQYMNKLRYNIDLQHQTTDSLIVFREQAFHVIKK